MFLIKKIVATFLLPTSIIFFFLLIGICFLWFTKKQRFGKLFKQSLSFMGLSRLKVLLSKVKSLLLEIILMMKLFGMFFGCKIGEKENLL